MKFQSKNPARKLHSGYDYDIAYSLYKSGQLSEVQYTLVTFQMKPHFQWYGDKEVMGQLIDSGFVEVVPNPHKRSLVHPDYACHVTESGIKERGRLFAFIRSQTAGS